MSLFDIAVAIVVGYCVISSLLKGMIKTVFSLMAYVGGCFTGYVYKGDAAVYLKNYVNHPKGAEILGFFALFISVTIIIKLTGGFIQKFMHEKGDLSVLDRFLGAGLGGVIGITIVAVILMLIEFFPKLDQQLTTGSVSAPYLKKVSAFLKQSIFLNETIKKKASELGLSNVQKPLKNFKQSLELKKSFSTPKDPPFRKDAPQDNYSDSSKKALEHILQTIQKQ